MRSIERELNEYLFLEFGIEEEEETSISDTWPFLDNTANPISLTSLLDLGSLSPGMHLTYLCRRPFLSLPLFR